MGKCKNCGGDMIELLTSAACERDCLNRELVAHVTYYPVTESELRDHVAEVVAEYIGTASMGPNAQALCDAIAARLDELQRRVEVTVDDGISKKAVLP